MWFFNEEELNKPLLDNKDNASSISSSSMTKSQDNEYDELIEKETSRIIRICSAYMKDFEKGRPTRLYPDSDYVSVEKLDELHFKRSSSWSHVLNAAKVSFFLASIFEGNELHPIRSRNTLALATLTVFSISVYCFDIYISSSFRQPAIKCQMPEKIRNLNNVMDSEFEATHASHPIDPKTVKERKRSATFILLSYLIILSIDTILFIQLESPDKAIKYKCIRSAAFKPIVLLYYSSKAREAFKALRLVLPMVLQAIILELFLTLTFSIIAFQLFGENDEMRFDAFDNFFISFINMFQRKCRN